MRCPACTAENRPGRRFCGQCGAPLEVVCPACGAANEPDERFCGDCGASLEAQPAAAPAPVTERRLASILFADLVGFTALAEGRDPERVRELLSRYFELAAMVVGRHGGTVEKFIGDAVVAVWGTPVAQEDDAERAVRTALELVAAVPDLEPGLAMRAAVSTGEAAVTVGARGEGMVAGDVVNTTARMQAAAPAGAVLIDDATHRATEAAIQCEPAGSHELKGKSGPVTLWRARQVVAERGGRRRAPGLEPPFVGRSRELRQVQDLLHAAAEERRAQLVSVIGIAGIGKTRLSWELEKYVDGLADEFLWHRGRCLSYGDGVAFWALAEMVRMRARISEEDGVDEAQAKLAHALEQHLPVDDERDWVRPALLHLLGLEALPDGDRARLFAAWRLFIERMTDSAPVMLVFEDMQWADQALLDFLEWSRDLPLFVLALARPELADIRPGWGAGSRNHTSLVLEPLTGPVMRELLTAMRLPAEVIDLIADRSEGIPLYAVETVRMLIDRGALVAGEDGFEAVAEVGSPEIPETLHALVLARLDALPADDRALLQDASVLGKTFTADGLAAVTGLPVDEIAPRLELLVRRELLSIDADVRSPERGQYGFVQTLARTVAYETMGLRDRKRRHLAAAAHLASIDQGDELVELVAMHTLDTYRAVPDDEDGVELRDGSRELLLRAAARARSLGAPAEAKRLTLTALELTDIDSMRAGVLEQAAEDTLTLGEPAASRELSEQALAIHTAAGDELAATHVLARIGDALFLEGHAADAAAALRQAYDTLRTRPPSVELAEIAGQYGRQLMLSGGPEAAAEPLELAIDLAEGLRLPDVLSHAMNTRGTGLVGPRPEWARTLLDGALRIALEHDLPRDAMRAYFNLSYLCECTDRDGRDFDRQGIAIANRLGDRQWERSFQLHIAIFEVLQGEWDGALETVDGLLAGADDVDDVFVASAPLLRSQVLMWRGQLDDARDAIAAAGVDVTHSDPQMALLAKWTVASLRLAEGRPVEALELAGDPRLLGAEQPVHAYTYPTAFVYAVALVARHDEERAAGLRAWLEHVPEGLRPPTARALLAWLGACFDEVGEPDSLFEEAVSVLRAVLRPWPTAQVLESHAQSLRSRGQVDDAAVLLREAEAIYEALGARPALERLAASSAERAAVS
jgi:class 3 adenylate cyclase/tetratricopeptide (TPR) repeat protein